MRQSRIGIRHLRCAIGVADAGGFRAAAEMLGIAQPAITKTVRDMEEDLGFAIFERGPKAVSLTAPGQRFVEDARQSLAQFERTIRAARRNETGTHGHIIIGYSALASSGQISQGLGAFEALCPGVQIEMHVLSTDSMMRQLASGEIDAGFLLNHETVTHPAISQMPVWSSPIGLVLPRESSAPDFEALTGAPFVMGLRENWRAYRLLLDRLCDHAGLAPAVAEEVWDVQVLFQRVAEGRGYTLYPMDAAPALSASLRMIALPQMREALTISMAWNHVADTALLRSFRAQFGRNEALAPA